MKLSYRSTFLLSVLLLICAAAASTYFAFTRDLEAAKERLEGTSKIIETASGPIEYATAGEGMPLLVVHGSGGGYDQGLDFAQFFAGHRYKVIAMSRFGYLRTPYPQDSSPEAQADAHANLLDALRIEKAAIVGASAGAPSAMQFAIRHPERCSALLVLVPLAYKPETVAQSAPALSPFQQKVLMTLVGSDFAFWVSTKLVPGTVISKVLATPPEDVDAASQSEKARVSMMMDHILPISQRVKGLMFDSSVSASLRRYDMEKIKAPTLVMSVKNDLYGTYASAQYTASQIPGAQFVSFDKGGHVWAGYGEEASSAMLGFLDKVKASGN